MNEQIGDTDLPAEEAPLRDSRPGAEDGGDSAHDKTDEGLYRGMGAQAEDDGDEDNDEDEEDEEEEDDDSDDGDEGEDVVAEYETVPSDETEFSGDTPL
ncbi:MAG: hypothetical protein WCD37_05425 [Chloroflexia bacterium]